ncbi:hypothetical protein MPSEU_001008700 [Mayamaea pseudoterrestris]|nr:hypothetical protein MPSEU_001008700 [Mayamaea pseudoterrestris]
MSSKEPKDEWKPSRASSTGRQLQPDTHRSVAAAASSSHQEQQQMAAWANYHQLQASHYHQQQQYPQQQYAQNDKKRHSLELYPTYPPPQEAYARSSSSQQQQYNNNNSYHSQHMYQFYGYPSQYQQQHYVSRPSLPPMTSNPRNSLGSIGSNSNFEYMRDYSRQSSQQHQNFASAGRNHRLVVPSKRQSLESRHQSQLQQQQQQLTPPKIGAKTTIPSPPPTTLNLHMRNKNRDSIGSTLSRDSIGNISLAPSQLDSFELDLKSPTSMVISALLHGASMIATVDRPDEEATSPVSHHDSLEEEDEKIETGAANNVQAASKDKENQVKGKPKDKKLAAPKPPRAKRALLPIDTTMAKPLNGLDLDEAFLNPVGFIAQNPELKRQIVILMALQRDGNCALAAGSSKTKAVSDPPPNIMQPGFFWRDYPPLETVLYDSMADYYDHSNASSRNQGQYKRQQAYNNSLVDTIRAVAAKHGFEMSQELMSSDKHLRDRIRCVEVLLHRSK